MKWVRKTNITWYHLYVESNMAQMSLSTKCRLLFKSPKESESEIFKLSFWESKTGEERENHLKVIRTAAKQGYLPVTFQHNRNLMRMKIIFTVIWPPVDMVGSQAYHNYGFSVILFNEHKDTEARPAAVHQVTKSRTQLRNWITMTNKLLLIILFIY